MCYGRILILLGTLLTSWGCGSEGPPQSEGVLLQDRYRQAITTLNQGGDPDRDPELCKAFAIVLDDLAAKGDPTVFVVVTEVSDSADPPEAALDLAVWKKDPEFPGDWGRWPYELPQDGIFGNDPAKSRERKKEILGQLQMAMKAIADERLVKLVPLLPGYAMNGRICLDVRATYRRGESYDKVKMGNAPYLLRGVSVDWIVKLSNREGKLLTTLTATTKPGAWCAELGSESKYGDRQGHLQYIGGVAACAQLTSAYEKFRDVLEKKLGTTPRE